jgi:hypothetical protein
MSDLEHVLRDTFQKRAAQHDPTAAARLLAVDYRPRQRRLPVVPVLGALGLSGAAAAVAAVVTLGSSAAPALAGWTPAPTRPAPGQTAAALQQCGSGTPVLTDTRGPYTAAVYAVPNGTGTCMQGGSVSFSGTARGVGEGSVAPGQIQTFVSSSNDSSGDAFTVLDGRVGASVTAVTIERSNGNAVTATVSGGWYLAWWPGSARATTAQITTASGTHTTALPAAATQGPPSCGGAGGCASVGYGSASSGSGGFVGGQGHASMRVRGGSK